MKLSMIILIALFVCRMFKRLILRVLPLGDDPFTLKSPDIDNLLAAFAFNFFALSSPSIVLLAGLSVLGFTSFAPSLPPLVPLSGDADLLFPFDLEPAAELLTKFLKSPL